MLDFKNDFFCLNPSVCDLMEIIHGDRIKFIVMKDKLYMCKSGKPENPKVTIGSRRQCKVRCKSFLFYVMITYKFTSNTNLPIRRLKSEYEGERLFEILVPKNIRYNARKSFEVLKTLS